MTHDGAGLASPDGFDTQQVMVSATAPGQAPHVVLHEDTAHQPVSVSVSGDSFNNARGEPRCPCVGHREDGW